MSAESEGDLNNLERALLRLTPKAALERDRVLFAAGRASMRRRGRWLLFGNAACAGLALTLAYVLWARPTPPPRTEIVTVHVPLPAPPDAAPAAAVQREPIPAPLPAESETLPALSYGYLHRRVDLLGEHALPPLPPLPPGQDVKDDAPSRAGRPNEWPEIKLLPFLWR